jgi:hypothetical protein
MWTAPWTGAAQLVLGQHLLLSRAARPEEPAKVSIGRLPARIAAPPLPASGHSCLVLGIRSWGPVTPDPTGVKYGNFIGQSNCLTDLSKLEFSRKK